jgi:uridine kinase
LISLLNHLSVTSNFKEDNLKRPFIIAISAVSGGGKTTAIQLLNKQLANSTALFFDKYDFEGPDNLIEWARRGGNYNEWKLQPLISDLTMILDNKEQHFEYILLDYPFAYLNNEMKAYIDLAIFIDTPLDAAMARRILRNQNTTTKEIRIDMETYLTGAREAYVAMLNTVKPNSDVVINGLLEKEILVGEIKKSIKKHLKVSQ